MALTKHKLGDLLELTLETNAAYHYGADSVMGMTITKEIIPTKADVSATDLSKFLVVHPGEFVFNPRTHGKHIGLGYNDSGNSFIISWNNIAFRVKESMRDTVLSEYLFLHFNRDEWDREACYRSWGSSTEVFSWDALCEMELLLPSLAIQQKYVDVYQSMLANQRSYERGLDDLKLTCDAYIENLRKQSPLEKIGAYIQLCDEKNANLTYDVSQVRGVSNEKELIETKADMTGVNLRSYYVIFPDEFAYVPVTSRNGGKISIAHNHMGQIFICSSSYVVFKSKSLEKLNPKYLMLFFNQAEFDRYARFHSWGSARETFSFDDMCDVQIPIPDISVQKALSDLFTVYTQRKAINEKLKAQIRDICPILIKGSIEEAEAGRDRL